MKRLKLKSNVKKIGFIGLVVIIFLFIGIFSTIKIVKQKNYEKTYEYKLINKGYSTNEAKVLEEKYKAKELDYILNGEKDLIYVNLAKEKYFIYDKFYTYLDYYNKNKDKPLRGIVEKVNTNTYKEYYTDPMEADISKKELMLVNKYYYLNTDYEPENLVTISLDYSYGDLGSQKITEDTYNAFLNLWKSANDEGYYLIINSSYRDYPHQESVYNSYKKQGTEYADKYAARPGYSEHQTGYSIDIFEKGYSSKDFEGTDSYKWLIENAHKYGFIQRYPKDKEDITGYSFESWHFRYVGKEVATYIYEHNITFDEYYSYFVK